ncbi:MAG: FecR domain-containing protein [Gammaproteobacteria bacterium]|nr:FecR domain-containing protein [Gammaproteobacteria bacterium]
MRLLTGFKLGSIFLLLTLLTGVVHAQSMGEVIRSENMPDYPAGTRIAEDSEIKTGDGQRIAIKTQQGDVLIANQNATIKLVKPGFFSHLFGKIYYFISSGKDRNVAVQTSTATLGIRGTKFIIDTDQADNSKERVSLVEGALNFDSNDDELFQLYRQRELDEFELYRKQQMTEFQEFKQQMMEEFVAYKASIQLEAGFALQFDGKKAVRAPLDPSVNSEIEEFEQFVAASRMQ